MANEFGEYNYRGVHVDVNRNKRFLDSTATSFHELTHQLLCAGSVLGTFDHLLMCISEFEENDKVKRAVKQLYDRVNKSSICVQESVAMFIELIILALRNRKKYDELLLYYKTESDYYSKYRFKEIEGFIDLDEIIPDIDKARRLMDNMEYLAILSLDIPLYDLDPVDGKYLVKIDKEKNLYNADYRFSKAIRYVKDNHIDMLNASGEECEKVFRDLGLQVTKMVYSEFKEWVTQRLLTPLKLREMDYYCKPEMEATEDEILSSICAYNSAPLAYKYEKCKDNKEAVRWFIDSPLHFLILNESIPDVINTCMFNLDTWQYSIKPEKTIHPCLYSDKVAVTDLDNYERIKDKHPKFKKVKAFVIIEDCFPATRALLEKQGVDRYSMVSLNESFALILMKGKGRAVYIYTIPKLSAYAVKRIFLDKFKFYADYKKLGIKEEKLSQLIDFLYKTKD